MKKIALLRGVTPNGKNRIPKIHYVSEILEDAGLSEVQTYIQSGNLVFESDWEDEQVEACIHDTILEKIGADLSVILKEPRELETAVRENPFDETYDCTRIHLVFTNDIFQDKLSDMQIDGEELKVGTACIYLYLPKDAPKKRLHTNYLERKLGITATMRKLSVITHLCQM